MNNAVTIAIVQKNKHEEIHDLDLFDCRVFAIDGDEPTPTKKGITAHVNTLPALIEALQQAEAEARRLGQITDRKAKESVDG